jgi:hypothetical protein
MKEGVIPSEIFTRLRAQFAEECHRQGRTAGPNHFEKDDTVLKMNLMLGDQKLLSLSLMLSKLRSLSETTAR